MSLPLQLSYIKLEDAKDVESVELVVNNMVYPIPRSDQQSGAFHKDLDEPLTLTAGQLSISVRRKKSRLRFGRLPLVETFTIDSGDVLSGLEGHVFQRERGKLLVTLGFASQAPIVTRVPNPNPSSPADAESLQPNTQQSVVVRSIPTDIAIGSAGIGVAANTLAPANRDSLRPTTEELIKQCPRFRVLVVGKSGVGKSTLINRIFGVNTANVARDQPEKADIEQEFTSPQNDRLILHDSKGFEAGDAGNYETVKSFIVERKKEPDIKNQLHAIPIPTYGERLLEDAAEAFLKTRKEVLGNTPTIVVFTKHGRLVTFMRQRMPNDPEAGQRYLQEECVQQIKDFTGENIAHVARPPAKLRYEHELRDLISITQDMVSMSFTSPGNEVSPVPLAAAVAQRMLPTLKVDLSVAVGKQKYWSALGTSANFLGHTIQDCLRVIHNDIVAVWNFYDPCQYLNSEEFRKIMTNMVERVDAPAEPNSLARTDTLTGGVPLIALAPVMLPLNAFLGHGKWVLATYQRLQDVPTKFMAYIVDLTHVLEILFSLTAGIRAKKLTRMAVKMAYKAYLESPWVMCTHTEIRHFQCPTTTRDAVLDKITSMISSDGREVQVSTALETLPRVDLEKDEEWMGQEVPQ
ncbi:hypothetical protein F5J12DRAFT_916223 [Pisolithus orientalis]|uniref:uncharacterized protein n=1 Tax=Pisolithus orientalis TaxID=936130 RepID=UPI002225712A|nr:uncharacterized protein F5J12DRAFT_916223 [Pisolithus orientalis]KAI5985705.1 hypothetical protein F5J12DRAFT_916223 [Pisolithus orientalis]